MASTSFPAALQSQELPVAQPYSLGRNIIEIVVTLVTALFLIGVIPAIIRYAVHPVGRMVQVAPTCSLSLGLLTSSSIGVALTLLFTIQLCRGVATHKLHDLIRHVLHAGGRQGTSIPEYSQTRDTHINLFTNWQSEVIQTSKTRDGIELTHYWFADRAVESAPTILLFNGNCGEAFGLHPYKEAYTHLGCNVCITDYRGYGLSGGTAAGPNQELEAYLDAEAALQFVLSKGVPKEHVVAHGLSLGGAYASALAYFYGVQHLILDHTFTSVGAVASYVIGGALSTKTLHGVIRSSYRQTSYPAHSEIENAKEIQPDGFDNLNKIRNTTGNLLILRGDGDHLMPMEFGEEFQRARKDDTAHTCEILTLKDENGGHDYCFEFFFNNSYFQEKIYNFLKRVNPNYPLTLRQS